MSVAALLESPAVAASNSGRTQLATVCAASAQYVVCSLVATTLFYRELYRLQSYPQFSNQLNTAGTTVTMGCLTVCLLPCCGWQLLWGGWSPPGVFKPRSSTSKPHAKWVDLSGSDRTAAAAVGHDSESWDAGPAAPAADGGMATALGGALFSAKLQLLLGLLNALVNLLQLMAIDGLGPRYSTLTTLLNQSTIPWTLLISAGLLQLRYSPTQLLGAAIVVAGVAAAVFPTISPGGGADSSSGSGGDEPGGLGAVVVWVAVFVLSCVPQSLLNVLIEGALPPPPESGGQPSARAVLLRTTGLVAMMNIVSIPFNTFGGAVASMVLHRGSLAPLWQDYADGWGCLLGARHGCEGAWADVVAFIPMGGLYVVSQILLIHHAGAVHMFLATALCLPLQNVVLALPAVMGAEAGRVDGWTFVGIAVTTAGLILYALAQRRPPGTARPGAVAAAAEERLTNGSVNR